MARIVNILNGAYQQPTTPQAHGEVGILRVRQWIEAIDPLTDFTSMADYGDATGVVFGYDAVSGAGQILGLNAGALQAYFDSDGKIKWAGGDGILDSAGMWLEDTNAAGQGTIYKGGVRFIHNYLPAGADGQNVFVGPSAGNFTMAGSGTQASYNSGFGYNVLVALITGSWNVAIGPSALYSDTVGSNNVAIGPSALYSNTIGGYDIAIGREALYSNISSNLNTAIGIFAMGYHTFGDENTAIGYNSGRFQMDGITPLTNSEYCIYIGTNARGKDNNDFNSIVIGVGAYGMGANTVVLGNSSIVTTYLKGQVNIADATADTSALNRQTGDARYCLLSTGYLKADGSVTGATGQAQALSKGMIGPSMTPDVITASFNVPAAHTALYNNMQVPPAYTVEVAGLLVDPGWS